MPLPDDFSPWQHLRETLTVAHNILAERHFLTLGFQPGDALDIETELGSLRTSVLIQDDDTVDMIILRLFLYYFVMKGELPQPVYTTPVADYQSEVTFKPQITLLFREDYSQILVENKLQRATAEISFRLMTETSQTMNSGKALEWAEKIKGELGQGLGFTWEKGTVKVIYRDLSIGVYFQLFAESSGEGQRVIEIILALAGHSFNVSHFSYVTKETSYPNIPPLHEVYGREIRQTRKRPITRVRFERAELHLHGWPQPIILVDRIGRYPALLS